MEGKDQPEVYKCVPCNKVFYKKNYLRKHDSRFHKVSLTLCIFLRLLQLKDVLQVEKSCHKCGKMFLFLRDFEKHAAQESCDGKFTINQLKESNCLISNGTLLLVPEPKKPVFMCSVCDKTFGMKYRLVSHVNLVHTQRAAHYKCRICSRTFAMASYLKSHCFRVHKINEGKIT